MRSKRAEYWVWASSGALIGTVGTLANSRSGDPVLTIAVTEIGAFVVLGAVAAAIYNRARKARFDQSGSSRAEQTGKPGLSH